MAVTAGTRGTRAPSRRSAGTRVGPFRLERYLGGGDDTEVWRADGDGIVVALKLRRAGTDDPLGTARLAREATVLRQVHHPALIGLFDAAEDDGEPYLAFTFHDGQTLAECIDDGRLPVAVAAATFAPLADALAVLHQAEIVHRDVKPANVLLTAGGPLLIDAGHASFAGTTYDGWVDAAPAIAGTTAYLAPEADTSVPDPALDVYALGVSLIEAITGRADADAAVEAPEPVRELLASCTATDPALRPAAATVATVLRAIAGTTAPAVGKTRAAVIDLTAPEPDEPGIVEHTANAAESGRSDEIDTLTAAARDGVVANELRAVLVTAPPGTGKSWLVEAAASRLERAGSTVVRAACSPARGDVRVVASWLLELGRDATGARELTRVAGSAPGAALLRAVGLSTGGETEMDPAAIADAMADVLAHARSKQPDQPLVCIVEDLHHASLELLDLLSRLAMRGGVPGGLWATTRPSWVDPDELGFEVLPLGPLAPDAIASLVGELGGNEPHTRSSAAHDAGANERAVEEILAVAGGNPLHAREAALALQRGESLDAQSTLPVLIAARFASYEPPLRDALGLAAACGDEFWPEALGRRFLDAVPDLYRAGVARVRMSSTLTASTEAHFRHPLLREVAYASLDEARRRELHGELGHALDRAGAPPEIVATQAGTAFRLGDGTVAPLAARAAADAGRAALDRFSLYAADDWIALLRETGAEPEPGIADLLDTELALDRGEYERARELIGTEPEHGPLAARRLVLATRSTYGTGDLEAAARYGARALALLEGSPPEAASHAVTYGIVLSRTGRHEEALNLLDHAAESARAVGDRGLGARLAAEAADVALRLHRSQGTYFTEAIARTRQALAEQREARDVRRYIASAPAFVETLVIDAPEEALDLAIDAAQKALALGDNASVGALAISICDTAIEAESADVLDQWLPYLRSSPLDATRQIEAEVLAAIAQAVRSKTASRIDRELLRFADRYIALGDVNRSDMPEIAAVCSLAWSGTAAASRQIFDDRVHHHLPPQLIALYELVLRAVEGPPWPLDSVNLPTTTMVHNERAMLHLLRGEDDLANALLRQRYEDRIRTTGSGRQRFSPYFPGALVAALGPSDTDPNVAWLLGWIHEPPFPGVWIAHRSICALLLAERAEPPEPGLAEVARRLIESTDADESVRQWVTERAERSGATGRDRGV